MKKTKNNLVKFVCLSREIADLKYGGFELSQEGVEGLQQMEEEFEELKMELEAIDRYQVEVQSAVSYIRAARTKAIISTIEEGER